MCSRASSGVRSRPSRPITTPTSSSKSSACEPGGAATGSPDPTAACGLPYRYVGCSYQAAIACSAFPVIVAAPCTCSSKATKSRNDAGRTGDRSRTRSDDTISITSSSDGAVRAVAAVSRSVPTGNSRTVATKMSSALTTPTRSWPSTSTRAYLTVRLLPPDRSDVDDGREGPLALVQHRDRLAERVLLEVRVGAVLLEGVLVVVDLEDLEDRRLVGVLVDDVGLAAGLFARRRREGGERLADDVLLAGLGRPGCRTDECHFSLLFLVGISRGWRARPWRGPAARSAGGSGRCAGACGRARRWSRRRGARARSGAS